MKENEVLSPEVFEYLKKNAPNLISSYYILSKFYEHMTNDFTHKVWKDGRIVLTPKAKENEHVREENVSDSDL